MHIAFDVIYCVKMTLRMHLINVNGRFFLQNFRKKASNIRNIYIIVVYTSTYFQNALYIVGTGPFRADRIFDCLSDEIGCAKFSVL